MRDLAIKTILENVKVLLDSIQDVKQEFITDEEYLDYDDILYDMPRVYEVSRHGYHIEYVVMGIDNGKVKCGAIGDDHGDIKIFDSGNLQVDELIGICENIS